MAPFMRSSLAIPREFNRGIASEEFNNQWTTPSDVFSVLLILGGDVIGRALAQLVGSRLTFVTFSFGWVAYAVNTVVSAVGENKLMPVSDCPCKIINGKTGYVRENSSWIIGRIVRDFDFWMMKPGKGGSNIQKRLNEVLDKRWYIDRQNSSSGGNGIPRPIKAGLCISVYEAGKATKKPQQHELLDYIGIITATVQLGIAAIPCGIFGDWSILLVTAIGSLLAYGTGRLPQWAKEKWACRDESKKIVILTKGNGSQHAIVVIGGGKGLDLEDLAAGSLDLATSFSTVTRVFILGLGVLWVLLLVAAAGIKSNTWFLLAVGGLGMLENLFVAGKGRTPESFGIPLTFERVIGEPKVMEALCALEESYPRVGRSMLDTFFPGKLRPAEIEMWDRYERRATRVEGVGRA
ncbi:hypothetical protein GGI35DRAFT_488663 [Trichoderma velutinum]